MPKIQSQQAFTLVEIMIVVGIISLLAAIAVPNLMTAKKVANQAAAKSNLRSLSSAAEIASISLGNYPATLAQFQNFIAAAPSYCANLAGGLTALQGYNYGCTMDAAGYTFVASPVSSSTGDVTYTATTGGVLTPI